jgi:signal transduction histidine kinase
MRVHQYLLLNEREPEQQIVHIQELQNRTSSLSLLLDELIEYDQIEAGKPMLKAEEIDLARLIRNCIQEVAEVSKDQPIEVTCDLDPLLGKITTDAKKLWHILANLVTNALKFTQHGTVTVRAACVGPDRWMLEVEDTGIGMDEAEQRLAFEDYYSGASMSAAAGMGLGLAIAQRLSAALGAQLSCSSEPGKGATFRANFPRWLESIHLQETPDCTDRITSI